MRLTTKYGGDWDAGTNAFPTNCPKGTFYTVSFPGSVTVGSPPTVIQYYVGECIIFDGINWIKMGDLYLAIDTKANISIDFPAGNYEGQIAWATDVGLNGAIVRSNGTSWYIIGDVNPWIVAPTLQNSWTNMSGEQPAEYRYGSGYDMVQLRGAVENGSAGLITTLPVGYRPLIKQSFAINVHDSGLSPPLAAFGHIIIDTDGTVTLEHPTTLSNHKVFLGHISFSIS